MVRFRSRVLKYLLITLVAVVLGYVSRGVWLPLPARYLVRAEAPESAEVAVVPGGDFYGNRVLTAADLARGGYVKKVLVSGPSGAYGRYECDLAIEFAVRQGHRAEDFIPMPNLARSTREEASLVVDELRRMGVHKFLLVTSNYHTRRAGVIYRSLARDLQFRVVAAPDAYFHPEEWWKSREGRKMLFFEWSKTIAEWMGW
ncbi:MAG: YdcF family protein [Acidobacteria bacterium]|nr:YdcF family protein [Acidobacteriota bacterium]